MFQKDQQACRTHQPLSRRRGTWFPSLITIMRVRLFDSPLHSFVRCSLIFLHFFLFCRCRWVWLRGSPSWLIQKARHFSPCLDLWRGLSTLNRTFKRFQMNQQMFSWGSLLFVCSEVQKNRLDLSVDNKLQFLLKQLFYSSLFLFSAEFGGIWPHFDPEGIILNVVDRVCMSSCWGSSTHWAGTSWFERIWSVCGRQDEVQKHEARSGSFHKCQLVLIGLWCMLGNLKPW